MLTRIEIDGFKTFEDFRMDLDSFQVILGPNACGKSNLFDAIHLLSRLVATDVGSAVSKVRGEPRELFRRGADGVPGTRIALAVEILLDRHRTDPWGSRVSINNTRLRYEVVIERRQQGGLEHLVVARERACPIAAKSDTWRPGGKLPSASFLGAFVFRRRSGKAFLETVDAAEGRVFALRDGRARQVRPADGATATILSSVSSSTEFPHLYALRDELQSWRVLQLVPAALHEPSFISAPDFLEPSGANLAKVLARIRSETATSVRPLGDLADMAADLATLVPGMMSLNVAEDDGKYRLAIRMKEGSPFSARVVSDGTLRILALLAILYDPRHRGVFCCEEPENGIHPARLKAVVRRLRELVTNPSAETLDEGPLCQLVLSSHSPVVLSCLDAANVVFFDLVTVVDPAARELRRKTRVRFLGGENRKVPPHDRGKQFLSPSEVDRYLCTVNEEA